MLQVTDIIDRVRAYQPAADAEMIKRAYDYSSKAHTGQKRKSGDPYFIHPASVAGIITELRLDTASVCAGLLHDVVEDTAWTVGDVSARFGPAVGGLVAAVSEDDGIANYRRRKRALRAQIARAGPDAIDIALADKVASLRYALERGKRVPKRKIAHYVATLAMTDAAGHPDLGRDVADLLASLDARDHPPVPLAP